MNNKKRSFLFLQGVCSPFFTRLANKLINDGHAVHKINFNAGDSFCWGLKKSSFFREPLTELPDFISKVWQEHGITDQILFGDQRPVHQYAAIHAEHFGIRTHVFEEGYFRPYWVTLEREGVNGHSLLPRDPDWFRDVGQKLPAPKKPTPFKSPFRISATHDVIYHTAGIVNPAFFHHYKTHAPVNAAIEYAGYTKRFSMLKLWKPIDERSIKQLLDKKPKYYVLPLQLNGDAQIKHHSRFESMSELIEFVMSSFAHHAPSDAVLVIKNHPLDMGLVNYQKLIYQLEKQFDIIGRTLYLESGNLDLLLKHAQGTITINSTVGGLALEHNCPTIALSDPIYNLPGLTFQYELESFWNNASKPDPQLYQYYRNTVMHTTQVNGGFYCDQGINLAINNITEMLDAEKSPLEKLGLLNKASYTLKLDSLTNKKNVRKSNEMPQILLN